MVLGIPAGCEPGEAPGHVFHLWILTIFILLSTMSHSPVVYYQATSILSVFASGMVVMTLVLFKTMRSKLFMQIIAFISLADILSNIEYTTTYRPSNHNWWCSTQGFLTLYGYPCSWLWTTMLMKFLYDLVLCKKLSISMSVACVISWGLPLITTLLYIAFIPEDTYQRPGDTSTVTTCSYRGTLAGFVWHMISYYGMFIGCICYMIHLYFKLRVVHEIKERTPSTNLSNTGASGLVQANAVIQRMKLTSDSLLLYPLIMVIFWCPHIIGVILQLSANESKGVQDFAFVATNMKILSGLATSILFFWKSTGSRTLWKRFLSCQYSFTTQNNHLDAPGEDMSYRDSFVANYSISSDSFAGSQYRPDSLPFGSSRSGNSISSHISMHIKHMSSPSVSNPLGRDLPQHTSDVEL